MAVESGMNFNDQLFDRLQAEHEAAWLMLVFVRPDNFPMLVGDRSVVVYGESGCGKTALRLAVAAEDGLSTHPHLIVNWSPWLQPADDSVQQTNDLLRQVMDECAVALTRYLCQKPARYMALPPELQAGVHWFIHKHIRGDLRFRLAALKLDSQHDPQALAFMAQVMQANVPELLPASASLHQVIGYLMQVLKHLSLAGLWVMVDDLEAWLESAPATLGESLSGLLSCLGLLERNGFAFKIFVPVDLKPAIDRSSGVARYRVQVYTIAWNRAQLAEIVRRRLALAFSDPGFHLDRIYPQERFIAWLHRVGDLNPRAWLDLSYEVTRAWMAQDRRQQLDPRQWERCIESIAPRQPLLPKLHVDVNNRRVFVGATEVEKLTGNPFKVLCYLYENRHRVCSREELYYRVIRGYDRVPSKGEKLWEAPDEWKNNLDNVIYKLKQKIERDPRDPVFIVNERGKGYVLRGLG